MFSKLSIQSRSKLCLFAIVAVGLLQGSVYANIFGADDRQPVLSREYPWRCIGLVVMETDSGTAAGTGFLIGRNLVLTNAHCVIDDATGRPGTKIHFYANRIDGIASNAVHVNHVWLGTQNLKENPNSDWAVLRLDSNLGDDLGWLDLSSQSVDAGVIAGYSSDYRNQVTAARAPCELTQILPWLVCHDGDATRGSSGGPVLAEHDGKTVVVALNFAEFRDDGDTSLSLEEFELDHGNFALAVAGFAEAVAAIRADQPTLEMADRAKQAREQIAARDFKTAYATLSRLIADCPTNIWARLLRANVAKNLGRTSDSTSDYRRALEIDPGAIDLLLERAMFCFSVGSYHECIAIANRAIAARGTHVAALKLLNAASVRLDQIQIAQASSPPEQLASAE